MKSSRRSARAGWAKCIVRVMYVCNVTLPLKSFHQLLQAIKQRLQRFEREARAAAALNHSNILAIYDVVAQDGSPYIVSELVEGASLRHKLLSGILPFREATNYATQIVHGLSLAHAKGIFHRDLKQENVFITEDGGVKILDFGLAKLGEG